MENISDNHFEEGFSLHDRVAVICPDAEFGDGVRDILEKKGKAYRFVAASEACANVTSFGAKADRPWIVVDAMDNFDGLERLIVIAAGLDGDTTSTDKRYLASRFYRALTRAHMLVVVINEAIESGMLNFIHEVEYDGEKMENKELYSAGTAIRSGEENSALVQNKDGGAESSGGRTFS